MLDNFFGADSKSPNIPTPKNPTYTDAYGVSVHTAQDVLDSDFLPFAVTDQDGNQVLVASVIAEFFNTEEGMESVPGLIQAVATIEVLLNTAHNAIIGGDVATSEKLIDVVSQVTGELIDNGLSNAQITQVLAIAAINIANMHHNKTEDEV